MAHLSHPQRQKSRPWAGIVLCAVLAILCGLSVAPVLASPPAGYYLVWGDEFNESSLDTTKWDYWVLGHFDSEIDVTNAVTMNGSNLVITTYSANNTNYSALIASDNHFRPRYGYYEASIAWGDTNGMCSAFWLRSPNMGTWVSDAYASGGEIDICEHRYLGMTSNYVADIVSDNIHWDGYGAFEQGAGSDNLGSNFLGQSFHLQTGFHLYGLNWNKNGTYGFYIDGTNMWNGTPAPLFGRDSYIIFSAEVNNPPPAWDGSVPPGGYPSLATSPLKLKIDYFHYYAPTNVLFWTGANSGNWFDGGNWVSNMLPAAGCDLTFSYLSSNLTNMTNGGCSVDGLIFLETTNACSIGGSGTLTLGSGGIDMVSASENVTLNCPINLASNQTWTVGIQNPGHLLTVNSSLSGAATLTKAGYGTLILNGANSFSGVLNVDTGANATNDGVLLITQPAALANVSSPIFMRDTDAAVSTLQLSNDVSVSQAINLAGRNTNVAAVDFQSGAGNALTGGLTLTGGGSYYIVQCDSGALSIPGSISVGSTATSPGTLVLQGNGDFSISSPIHDRAAAPLSLVKTNNGTLTLSGANTYTGPTTNAGGNLFLNGSLAGPLVVNAGILAGTGSVAGDTSIQGGEISPGSAIGSTIGTLSFGGNLTLGPRILTLMVVNAAAQTNGQLAVAGTVTYGGTLYVANLTGNFAPGQGFQLFSASNYVGGFAAFNLPALAPNLAWNTDTLTNGVLSIIPVPPTISIVNLGGGQAQLSWPYGTLQTSTNAAGPYTDITGATAPYTIPASNSQNYYRLR